MAEADQESETLKSVTSDLTRALECPICLDVVKHPFVQCARGHLMCVGCLQTLTSCPTCKGALVLENPVCIKQLIEYLPHDCQYSINGCEKTVQYSNGHEKFCGFRHIVCRFPNCDEDILAKDLSHHYKTVHSGGFIALENEIKSIRWPGPPFNGSLPIHLFNNFFWFSFESRDEKVQRLTFEVIPVGKPDGNYYAKVSFSKGNFSLVLTLKAFPVEHDNDLSVVEAEIDPGDNFWVELPNGMFSHYIDEVDCYLKHDLLIFKGESESSS